MWTVRDEAVLNRRWHTPHSSSGFGTALKDSWKDGLERVKGEEVRETDEGEVGGGGVDEDE